MPKREKRLTKRERKELLGKGPSGQQPTKHIHCIACGRHIDPSEFATASPSATMLACQHGSQFPACTLCVPDAQSRIDEHDRLGQPPRVAPAWH